MATQTMNHSTHAMSGSNMKTTTNLKMGHYTRFGIMMAASFIAMYFLMYSMVDVLPNVYNSINQVYMVGLMVAPMAIIELLLMKTMYTDKKKNVAILTTSVLALGFFYAGVRNQIGVGDQQFVRSMIPHHSGAILMCNEAGIQDPELKSLCGQIVKSQQQEIDQMKEILARLSK